MEPERKDPSPSWEDELDPAWRSSSAPPSPAPQAKAPPAPAAETQATAAPKVPPPVTVRRVAPDEEAPVEPAPPAGEAPVEEVPVEPEPPGEPVSPAVPVALFVVMLLGAGLFWHLTAPRRSFNRGAALLSQARRKGDPKAAAAALAAIKPYVDSSGAGYDRLFEAAALAGDDATGAAYEERLLKSAPSSGPALLVWYESALTYHAVGVRTASEALGAATDPAEKQALVEKIRVHREAAAALKPTRVKAVEEFGNGFPPADAARLLRIDAMQSELAAVDLASLSALAVSTATAR